MPTRFILLRHAEGWDNKAAGIYGPLAYTENAYANASLTSTGFEQARAALKDVDMQTVAGIFCSPMQACYQTLLIADPDSKNEPVILDDRLLEPQNGLVCHKRASQRHLNMMLPPKWVLSGILEKNPFDRLDSACPCPGCVCVDVKGVETDTDFGNRVRGFTEWMQATYADHTVVIVAGSHWISSWLQLYGGEVTLPGYGRFCEAKI